MCNIAEKSIFQYDNSYHDLNSYPDINGYAQWGINGLCWLDTQNTSNSFGISYNLSPKLTTIYNKRDCFYFGELSDAQSLQAFEHFYICINFRELFFQAAQFLI